MQPIEIEITNQPEGTKNPVECFVRALISETRKPFCKPPWEKVTSPKTGFRLRSINGAETLLTLDSQDEQHIQISLHSISADGEATIDSVEWIARANANTSDLYTLYNLLESQTAITDFW